MIIHVILNSMTFPCTAFFRDFPGFSMISRACGNPVSMKQNTVFNLIKASYISLFQNSISSLENSVDPDQLASNEAS